MNKRASAKTIAGKFDDGTSVKALDRYYEQYVERRIDKRTFETKIIKFLMAHSFYYISPNRNVSFDEFLSWFYHRFSRVIDKYKPTQASFDTYMNTTIRFAVKEFQSKDADRKEREAAYHQTEHSGLLAAENATIYESEQHIALTNNEPQSLLEDGVKIKNNTRVLILLLKSYYSVDDKFIDRVAAVIKMPREKIYQMVEKLHSLRWAKLEKFRISRERCHSQYARCVKIKNQLHKCVHNSARWKKLEKQLHFHQKRLENMRKRLRGIRLDATNSEIAQLLGIPKGTVDSHIFIAKRDGLVVVEKPSANE
jgi:hypothetical protein